MDLYRVELETRMRLVYRVVAGRPSDACQRLERFLRGAEVSDVELVSSEAIDAPWMGDMHAEPEAPDADPD